MKRLTTALPSELVLEDVFESASLGRVYDNASGCCAPSAAEHVAQWRESGAVVVFASGVFDLLHPNHLLSLTCDRIFGAQLYRERNALEDSTKDELARLAASSAVKLLVSVDSDVDTARRKGFNEDKGGCPRPVVSWQNRQRMLAHQYMSDTGSTVPLVDYIITHGEGSCTTHKGQHDRLPALVADILPDLWVVNNYRTDR